MSPPQEFQQLQMGLILNRLPETLRTWQAVAPMRARLPVLHQLKLSKHPASHNSARGVFQWGRGEPKCESKERVVVQRQASN